MILERLVQDAKPAIELAPEDPVRAVGLVQRPAGVDSLTSQMSSGELELELDEARAIDPAEVKSDHDVAGHPPDEVGDDLTENCLPTQHREV